MKVQSSGDQWKTNNQAYGEHANIGSSNQSLKHKAAISTLDRLMINDPRNFVQHV
jgi:hypothetical protein